MSILTKVFVVLVSLLAVLLVALIVPFVANTQNYRDQLAEAKNEVAAAREDAKNYQTEIGAVQERHSEQIASLKAKEVTLVNEINTLKNALTSAEADGQSKSNQIAQLEADRSRIAAVLQQNAEMLKAAQTELGTSRQTLVNQGTKIIQLSDANNELQSQVDTFSKQVRHLQERTVEQEEKILEFEGMFAKLPQETRNLIAGEEAVIEDAAGAPFEPRERIDGTITRVERIGDETFLQIDIGRKDGVARNMAFRVHRGAQFLGRLVVSNVDDGASAGTVALLQGIEIQPGDRVQTGGIDQN